MNLCLNLIVLGFLLWDQNHFTLGNTTIAPRGSDTPATDSNQTTSSPDVPPSPRGDNKTEIPDCSGTNTITTKSSSYREQTVKLELDLPDNLKNKSLTCTCDECSSGEYNIALQSYAFNASSCIPANITCWFDECPDKEFSIRLDVPPQQRNYTLNITAETRSIHFNWYNPSGLELCDKRVESQCVNGSRNFSSYYPNGDVVNGLTPYTEYNCTSSLLYNGEKKTETSITRTKIDKPGDVQDLSCVTTTTTVRVTWEEPREPNGPLDGYRVMGPNNRKEDVGPTEARSKTFDNLQPYTEYSINVAAYNKDGVDKLIGSYTPIMCRTKEGIPDEVTSVYAHIGPSHNDITIKCNEPRRINGERGVYILYIDEVKHKIKTNCDFTIKDLSYLTTYSITIRYKNNMHEGKPVTLSKTTKYNDKALIGFLAFFITITCLALIFVMFKIYKLQKRSSCNFEDHFPLTQQDDEKQLLNIEPIPVEHLLETYKRKNADEGRLFLDEFQSIPRVFSKFPIKEARKPYNQSKNRYIDILPYDDNRVVLYETHGEPGSDYINASYINGFKEPRKYIAAQGPKEETMNDFWRMIWEQKSTIIVMVTRCEEGNRNKCAQYWPTKEDEMEEYGEVTVKNTGEKYFPDYIIRKLHIANRREKSERDITHIQFTVWPDHGVPEDPNLLLKLRRRVNALSNFFSGPIIVHCSAGVGRTGTYISIDAMLEGLEAESRVDVYGYVVQLRRQRCLMVQVEAQYIFIHKSLVEYNQFGETEISTSELPRLLNNMKESDLPSEPSQLNCEFQRLPSYKNWRPQNTGNHQDNKDKNRHSSVVPYEFNRVQVKVDDEPQREYTEDSEMSSDEDSDSEESLYINASYIIGYWGSRSIVAAQAPLKNTLSEFWKLIYQRKTKAIVLLCGPNQENNEGDCAPYWEEKSKTYGDLEVELTDEHPCGSYTERSFEIRHTKRKDVRKVSQFHYNQWEDVLPKEAKGLLEMIEKVKKNASYKKAEEQSKHDRSAPLLVHCSNGSQRTGTFCALWILLESAQVEEVIDVFQTVKNLRRQRPGMVSSFEQYEFLYDTLASTIPAQNGQVKITIHQEDKLEIQKEMKNKTPEEKQEVTANLTEDTLPKPKEDETVSNGPSATTFTDISLRIDE